VQKSSSSEKYKRERESLSPIREKKEPASTIRRKKSRSSEDKRDERERGLNLLKGKGSAGKSPC
jgi:hypothetical protein